MDFENHIREAFVEQAYLNADAVLRNEKVKKALGADALKLYKASQTLFLPDIIEGVATCPNLGVDIAETDLVPVVALQPGESIIVDASLASMSVTQRSFVNAELKDFYRRPGEIPLPASAGQLSAKIIKDRYREQFKVGLEKRTLGRVANQCTIGYMYKKNIPGWYVTGRPFLALNMQTVDPIEKALVTLHEYVHIYNRLRAPMVSVNPFFNNCAMLTEELTAYSIQAAVAKAINIEASTDYINQIYNIDEYIREECGLEEINHTSTSLLRREHKEKLAQMVGIQLLT